MFDAASFLGNLSNCIDGFMYSCMNNSDYTMTYLSSGFKGLSGHDIDRFIRGEMGFSHLIHEEDLPRVDAAVAAAVSARRRWQMNYRVKTASGHVRHVLETGGGRVDEAGNIAYLDGIVIDFGRANDLADRIQAGQQALGSIAQASDRIVDLLRSLRMLSLNARIEAARSAEAGAGFAVVAKEMGQLTNVGDEVTNSIAVELSKLKIALQV